MTLRFGTDGVRGAANVELTPELVLALGRAAARVLGQPGSGNAFLIGRDTRESGTMLQAALTAGITAENNEVIDVGVVPTPAVAWASASRQTAGAMISASHNPYGDNGIKFFAAGGTKLSDEVEERLEAELERTMADATSPALGSPSVGTAGAEDVRPSYSRALLETVGVSTLAGLPVVLDCANGSASGVAPGLFRDAGAQVHVIHAEPDGRNINAGCGSTHPADLQRTVLEQGAAVGLAFDGDADRLLAVDETGALVDGDHLLALFATDLKERGRLPHDALVVTVMSNLGLKLAMREAGVKVVETSVGDRYVLAAMEEGGFALGGEQSGHIIFGDLATTGDGLLAGLQLLDLLRRAGQPLSELAAGAMTTLPQVLRNVRVASREALEGASQVWAEVAQAEKELGERGRVLLRPSGTEPLVRVMVEADDAHAAEVVAARLVAVVEGSLGPATP